MYAYSLKEASGRPTTRSALAPVVCYDPWFPRAIESFKQSLVDGHPVLIRLHSGASYPIRSPERYQIDLESHAVLIIGYDDEKQAFEIIDPWDNRWGGALGGRRWLSRNEIERQAVDCSLGMSAVLAPLMVFPRLKWDPTGNVALQLNIGFYTPRGTVMDKDSWAIKELRIACNLSTSPDKPIDLIRSGNWVVGEQASITIPLSSNPPLEAKIHFEIEARIVGSRPYTFEDSITVIDELQLEKENQAWQFNDECAMAMV